MDDNRVSPMEERALTNAIERAATVASINKDLDRNQLLVNQLKKASIDPKFAKTASQAFNKRLTVLTFQKTADEHKADSFPLTDGDVVYNMMLGETPVIEKATSFNMSIESSFEPSMEKAASEKAPVLNRYEKNVSMETFEKHLETMMDKYAGAIYELNGIKSKLADKLEKEADEVASIFKQAHYDYDFTTAVNLYGDKLKEAIGDKLDKAASFVPTSKFVIKPQKAIFEKVAQLMEDRDSLEAITKFEDDFVAGVTEFCKSAAKFGEDVHMLKFAGPISDAVSAARTADDEYARMAAHGAGTGAWQARANAALDVLGGGIAGGIEGGINSINNIVGASRAALGNARALYAAGNNVSISPGDLLDAAFLTKDRYRDRLLAWSDMSADPQLALYPSEQVFQATNKAMDMDTSLERPDQRELLRTQVAQLLAQNNRASTADIAALAATLKALSSARPNAAIAADTAVQALEDKKAPERPELEKIVGEYGNKTDALHDLVTGAQTDFDNQMKALDAIDAEARKDYKEELGKKRDAATTAKGNVSKVTGSEAKKLLDIIGYHATTNPRTGELIFAPNKGIPGKVKDVPAMKAHIQAVLAQLQNNGLAFEPEALANAKEQLRLT